MQRDLGRAGIGDRKAELNEKVRFAVSLGLDQMSPVGWTPTGTIARWEG